MIGSRFKHEFSRNFQIFLAYGGIPPPLRVLFTFTPSLCKYLAEF
nr:MAG TPA: hypothetical protein [Caudoviricetes sp.]